MITDPDRPRINKKGHSEWVNAHKDMIAITNKESKQHAIMKILGLSDKNETEQRIELAKWCKKSKPSQRRAMNALLGSSFDKSVSCVKLQTSMFGSSSIRYSKALERLAIESKVLMNEIKSKIGNNTKLEHFLRNVTELPLLLSLNSKTSKKTLHQLKLFTQCLVTDSGNCCHLLPEVAYSTCSPMLSELKSHKVPKDLLEAAVKLGIVMTTSAGLLTAAARDNSSLNYIAHASAVAVKSAGRVLCRLGGKCMRSTLETIKSLFESIPEEVENEEIAEVRRPWFIPPMSSHIDSLGRLASLFSTPEMDSTYFREVPEYYIGEGAVSDLEKLYEQNWNDDIEKLYDAKWH
jgi:hypothetical protein